MADLMDPPDEDFIESLQASLAQGQPTAVLKTIKSGELEPALQNRLSEAIPILTAHLNEDVLTNKPALFRCSQVILAAICDKFEPEGVLLQLIEDVEKACDDTTFLNILKPLQKVLLRLPRKRLNSLGWGLHAIHMYLTNLDLSDNLEEEDEAVLINRISIMYMQLIPFYQGLFNDQGNDDSFKAERKIILLKFLIQLLGKPLALLDLKSPSQPRQIAEHLLKEILCVTPDIVWLLELQTSDPVNDIGEMDDLPLATLYYLVVVEQVLLEKVPKVYDRLYVFQQALHLSTELFKYNNQYTTRNGLELSQTLMETVRDIRLPFQLLDSGHHSGFCKALTNTIIYNQVEEHRQKGLQIFRCYLFQFETHGQFLLIYNLMKVLNHSGIIGYIITQFKDMLMHEFSKPVPDFSGFKLNTLLNMFCFLHKGEESDLVELADQIVATLNLLRYLAIRDKGNVTNIWHHFEKLNKSYLEPLKRALMLSRAHYELKIKELKEEDANGNKGDSRVSVLVAGEQLDEMPTSEKLLVLHSAMTSFDIMESLLSRVNELIEAGLPT